MVRRLLAANGTYRDNSHCTLCVRTLTTVWRKRTQLWASLVSRSGFIAARFWTRRLRWLAGRALIRLTSRAAATDANAVHARDVSAKGAMENAATDRVAVAVEIEGIEDKRGWVLG